MCHAQLCGGAAVGEDGGDVDDAIDDHDERHDDVQPLGDWKRVSLLIKVRLDCDNIATSVIARCEGAGIANGHCPSLKFSWTGLDVTFIINGNNRY